MKTFGLILAHGAVGIVIGFIIGSVFVSGYYVGYNMMEYFFG